MALIECPDCGRKVSDRASSCPDCACPVAETVAEQRAVAEREEVAGTREMLDEAVDCPRCEARGFYRVEDGLVSWCIACEHSGRLSLAKASDGYYGVARYAVEKFLAREIHPDTSGVVFFIDERKPTGHRFPKASPRTDVDPADPEIPW